MDEFLGGALLGAVLTSWVWVGVLFKLYKWDEEAPGDGRGWK